MHRNRQDGAITVFLSIILLIVIVLVGTLVDGARVITAENQVQRATNTAARSILANYKSELKEQYGLFAFKGDNPEEIANEIAYFMNKSLNPEKDLSDKNIITKFINGNKRSTSFFDLYDYSISNSSSSDNEDRNENNDRSSSSNIIVNVHFDLEQNEVLKKQILEYMKYRAPKEIIENFLKKLDVLKKSGKTAKLVKEKIEVENTLSKIADEQEGLSEKIELINSFDKSQYDEKKEEILSSIKELNEQAEKIKSIKIEIKECQVEINNLALIINTLEREITIRDKENNSDNNYDGSNDDLEELKKKLEIRKSQQNSLKQLLSSLEEELDDSEKNIKGILNQIREAYDDLREYFGVFINHNVQAENILKQLVNKSLGAESKIDSFEKRFNSEEYQGKIITEAEHQIRSDIESFKDKLKGVKHAEFGDKSFSKSNINNDIFLKAEKHVKKIKDKIMKNGTSIDKSALYDMIEKIALPIAVNCEILTAANLELDELNTEITRIEKIIGKESISETIKMFRNTVELKFKSSINIINSYSNEIRYIDFSDQQKGEKKEKADEIKKSMEKRDPSEFSTEEVNDNDEFKNEDFLPDENRASDTGISDKFQNLPSRRKNIRESLGNIINKNSETDMTQINNSLDLLTKISDVISDGVEGFRDDLYINEYIMSTFRCASEEVQNTAKYNRPAYFDEAQKNCEIEYILNGSPDWKRNLRYTQAQIYTIRTAMNLIHIYSDPRKMHIATQIGLVAAGLVPIAAPLITTVIIFGWASLESLLDMNDLMNGKEVPFYKIYEEEWKIGYGSIGHFKDKFINDAAELGESLITSFIEKLVGAMFNQIENNIFDSFEKANSTIVDNISNLQNVIDDSIASVLDTIPNEKIKETVKEAIGIEAFTQGIKSKTTEIIDNLGVSANSKLEKLKDEALTTVKSQIHEEINSLKNITIKKLNNTLENNIDFRQFVEKNGQSTLSNISKKSFNVKFNYQDYLRILLLIKDENTRLRRIMDLIELNMQEKEENFLISDYHTFMKVDVIASIKYLFMTNRFIPREFTFDLGSRYGIKSSVMQGY